MRGRGGRAANTTTAGHIPNSTAATTAVNPADKHGNADAVINGDAPTVIRHPDLYTHASRANIDTSRSSVYATPKRDIEPDTDDYSNAQREPARCSYTNEHTVPNQRSYRYPHSDDQAAPNQYTYPNRHTAPHSGAN